jgi:hypothetical protein
MLYSSAVLFAALMVWGSMSPVFACRGANNATMVKLPADLSDRFVSAGLDQYNIKVDPDTSEPFRLIRANRDVEFCVNVSVLDSSDLQNTKAGVMFWSTVNYPNNAYYLYIRNDQYQIVHAQFGLLYELVPWTTQASIKKGLRQKNEVDLRLTAAGADIQINGTQLPNLVARPPADPKNYGVVFQTPKTGTGLFQIESLRIVK